MQTSNTLRWFGLYPYGLVLVLVLLSAIVGTVGGYYFGLPVSSAPSAAISQPVPQAAPPQEVGANAIPDTNELRQEMRELRQAHRESATAPSMSIPVTGVDASQVQNEPWQEKRDLQQMQKSLRSATNVALGNANIPVPTTAAERYHGLNERQLEWLETLP